jgi:predicted ATPase
VESLPTARILLLVNYRPEYAHAWGNRAFYTQVRVDPLGEDGAEELLAGLLGDDPSLEPLKALLAERTQGNPLFLEESVRSLAETGALVGERGAYRLPLPLASLRMPATVQAVLAARIDRLSAQDKSLLQTAAVIGKDVPDPLLRAVADRPDGALRRELATLQVAEFLYEASLFPELEYTFKHALTHEVAYGSLLQDRRKVLHARVVDAIEGLYADRLAELTERLAHHALRAEDWIRAVPYARSAGRRATARSAYRDGVTWLEYALDGLPHIPDSREAHELAVDIRLDLWHALAPLAPYDRMAGHLREAAIVAETMDDRGRLSGIYALMADTFRNMGRCDQAIEFAERARSLAEGLDDILLKAYATLQLALARRVRGELRQAADGVRHSGEYYERLVDSARFGLSRSSLLSARSSLGWTLAELGEFDEAIEYCEEGVRASEAINDHMRTATSCSILGRVFGDRGQIEQARRVLA